MKKALLWAMALCATVMGAQAGDLQQSADGQEQIRGQAQQLVSRLDEVIAEYTRNGLAKGGDFEVLKNVRTALGSLSEEEMAKVVALLNEADSAPKEAPDRVAKAYADQKDISLRLKQILAEHERQQDIEALASAVRQLADRQAANLSTAIDVEKLAAQDGSANGQAAVTASVEGQQAEQNSIAGEVTLIAEKIKRFGTDAGDAKFQTAATQLTQVQTRAAAAADALAGGKLDDAVTEETATREALAEIARDLTPADKQQGYTTAELEHLQDLARQQRALLNKSKPFVAALKKITDLETPEEADKAMAAELNRPGSLLAKNLANAGITPDSPLDDMRKAPEMQQYLDARAAWLKRQEDVLQPKLAALAADQAAVTEKAQMVREDLDKSKDMVAPMTSVVAQMASAQAALAQGDGERALQAQTDAANQLDQAARTIQQSATASAASAAPQTQPAGGKEQQLQQLEKQVADLTAREAASLQQGDAAKTWPASAAAAAVQQNMAGKAQGLPERAAVFTFSALWSSPWSPWTRPLTSTPGRPRRRSARGSWPLDATWSRGRRWRRSDGRIT